MNVINTKESYNESGYKKVFMFDNTVQINSLIDIIKQFENDKVKMMMCQCYTYNNEGHREYYRAASTNAIKDIYAAADSPYFDFDIDFADSDTLSYAFSLVTSINSSYVIYEENKKKASRFEKTSKMRR